MKRLLTAFLLICVTLSVFGQTQKLFQAKSDHYRVYSDVGEAYAQEVAYMMEAALKLYNSIFHFDLSALQASFRITIYKDKAGFDRYLEKLLGESRDDFVYIHYSDIRKCELVGFKKDDVKDFTVSLLHQGLIQCLKSFVPSVPYWISEGVAAYIETSTYSMSEKAAVSKTVETDEDAGEESVTEAEDESGEETVPASDDEESAESSASEKSAAPSASGTFTLNKSLLWLETLKSLMKGEGGDSGRKLLPLSDLLLIDKEEVVSKIDVFYPQAWGLVYFLLNTDNKNYNRLFWDSLNLLDPSLTLKENSVNIKNRIFKWIALDTFNEHFRSYFDSLKTFNDLVTEGLDLYTENNLEAASERFVKAIDLKPSHYFPYYYLGLIAYTQKDYYKAEEYYLEALELGSDKALTYYALGVNAYADNNYENAIVYLNDAKKQNKEKYGEKVELIINRIESETKGIEDFMDGGETDIDFESGGA
ncbi:MAG: tetratricopeptide repeat protein [Spirochaetales bacterium]|nr:tetratricopeptide repeat protein [Spirochaetales bacterium]